METLGRNLAFKSVSKANLGSTTGQGKIDRCAFAMRGTEVKKIKKTKFFLEEVASLNSLGYVRASRLS